MSQTFKQHVGRHLLLPLSCLAALFCGYSASAKEAPVKVYILAGQSNMVGIGQVDGGGKRWGEEFIDPVLSIYPGTYDAPDAPFVVTTCGFNGGVGWEPGSSADTIFNAQMNVSDPSKHPEYKGTIKSVDTRPFYHPPEESPRNQSFHYHGNAETYMRIGEEMGKAILELL